MMGSQPRIITEDGFEVVRKDFEDAKFILASRGYAGMSELSKGAKIRQVLKPILFREVDLALIHRRRKIKEPCTGDQLHRAILSDRRFDDLQRLEQEFGGSLSHRTKSPILTLSFSTTESVRNLIHKMVYRWPFTCLDQNREANAAIEAICAQFHTLEVDYTLRLTQQVPWAQDGSFTLRIEPWKDCPEPPPEWVEARAKLQNFTLARYFQTYQNLMYRKWVHHSLKAANTWGQLFAICPPMRDFLLTRYPTLKLPKKAVHIRSAVDWDKEVQILERTRELHSDKLKTALAEGLLMQNLQQEPATIVPDLTVGDFYKYDTKLLPFIRELLAFRYDRVRNLAK